MTRRLVPAPPAPVPLVPGRTNHWTWTAAVEGREPAEVLDPRDREDLVAELVTRGWTDVQIAVHTRMTTYTTARIRERLGLRPSHPGAAQRAA